MTTPIENQISSMIDRINRLIGIPSKPRPLSVELAELQKRADEYLGEISRSLDALTNRTDHKEQ